MALASRSSSPCSSPVPIYHLVERGPVRVKCLAQEHNTTFLSRASLFMLQKLKRSASQPAELTLILPFSDQVLNVPYVQNAFYLHSV